MRPWFIFLSEDKRTREKAYPHFQWILSLKKGKRAAERWSDAEENLDEATEDQRPMPQLTEGASRSPGKYTGQESKLTLSCRAWRVLRFVELPSQKVLRISSREPSVQHRFHMFLAQQWFSNLFVLTPSLFFELIFHKFQMSKMNHKSKVNQVWTA